MTGKIDTQVPHYWFTHRISVFSVPTPVHREYKPPPRMPPDLPLELWLEIFQFATYVYQDVSVKPLDPFTPKQTTTNALGANTPSLAMRTKLAIVQVSRAWRRVALQTLYQHVVIRSPSRANAILKALQSSPLHMTDLSEVEQLSMPRYGQYVRHIEVFTFTRGSKDIKYLQLVFQIIQLCPDLRMLSGRWIHALPTEFLNGLSALLGPSLSELLWSERQSQMNQNTNTSLQFLNSFQALRVLDLRHFVGSKPSSWPERGANLCLPLVQSLIISSNPRSLDAATRFELPSLRNLTMLTSASENMRDSLRNFLKAHGKSLVMIDLPHPSVDSEPDPDNALSRRTLPLVNPDIFLGEDFCPNLEAIVFSTNSTVLQSCAHPNLRRIGLRGIHIDGLYPEKPSSSKEQLMSFNVNKYPRLQLIQAVGFLVEANSDSLAKDLFIWWVEWFESMDVLLVDGEGVKWAYYPDPIKDTGAEDKLHISNITTPCKPLDTLQFSILQENKSEKSGRC